MELVVFLGKEKETLPQVSGLIKKGDWEKVILVGNNSQEISYLGEFDFIAANSDDRVLDMRNDLKKKIRGKIRGTEVALSIASGNGKEHMALISALLSLPVGIRFVALTKDGVIEL